jgi:hypothetical protein
LPLQPLAGLVYSHFFETGPHFPMTPEAVPLQSHMALFGAAEAGAAAKPAETSEVTANAATTEAIRARLGASFFIMFSLSPDLPVAAVHDQRPAVSIAATAPKCTTWVEKNLRAGQM